MAGTISDIQSSPEKLHKIEILPSDHVFWGILEEIEPIGAGLILAKISGTERLVDEGLLSKLSGRMGQKIVISHVFGQWGAGGLSA
jgi:hypothetical protein